MSPIMARWIEGEPRTTIRLAHTAHPRIEGTKVSSRVAGSERFKQFPSGEGDIVLLIEPAATDFTAPTSEALESLTSDAVSLRDATEQEQRAKKAREETKGRIFPVIENHPKLRGLISESRDVKLTATPTHTEIIFDTDKLKESVRSQKRFRKLTSRRVSIEITPRKDMTPEVLRALIEEGLNSLGARVARRSSIITTWIVDDGAVAEMVDSGEITLLPGTRQVQEGLSIKAERFPIKKRKDTKSI